MNPDPHNFEDLRRLLALKRHEQPPPGYFHHFSHQVIARIEAGERGEHGSLVGQWLQRFWQTLEAKPVFAGAAGVAACALVLTSALYAPTDSTASATTPQPPTGLFAQMTPISVDTPVEASFSSMDGATSGSLFEAFKNLESERGLARGQLIVFPAH